MATTTINIPSLNVVQTTAEWASDSTVYTDKYVLWNSDLFYGATDQMQFKKADGTQTFANLDYMPIGAGGGDDHITMAYSNLSGGALTDSSDYFLSLQYALGSTINSFTSNPIFTGTVVEAVISTFTAGPVGSSEGVTFTLIDELNSTIGVIATDITYDAKHSFFKKTLNIPVTEGMTFIRMDVPVMVTNPNATKTHVELKIKL